MSCICFTKKFLGAILRIASLGSHSGCQQTRVFQCGPQITRYQNIFGDHWGRAVELRRQAERKIMEEVDNIIIHSLRQIGW